MIVDCEKCVMHDTAVCADCVVTFVVGRAPGEPLRIDREERQAVRMLAGAGLVPSLRHCSTPDG